MTRAKMVENLKALTTNTGHDTMGLSRGSSWPEANHKLVVQDSSLRVGLAATGYLTLGENVRTSYDHSDTGNAELLNDLYGKDIRYDPKQQRWLQWRDTHRWHELNPAEINGYALKALDYRFELAHDMSDATKAGREVAFAVRSRNAGALRDMIAMSGLLPPIGNYSIHWDNQPNLLAVGNGVVNLANGKLRVGQRNDYLTRGLVLPYNPDATAPTWMKFLDDITCGRQELIEFLQRAVGYTLTGFTTSQVFFLLFGEGSNGKSVFTEIISELLSEFAKNIRFTAFDENSPGDARRDLAELPGIRAAFASEGSKRTSLETSIIKEVTGGTSITTSRKYGHPFEYRPQFKLWLTTNNLPKVDDDTYGFWRRLIIIPFDATFEGKTRDDRMKIKLISELPGILTWAIKGAELWTKHGLQTPDSMLLKVTQYRQESDVIENFLKECCDISDDHTARAAFLYEAFKLWCKENGHSSLSNSAFGTKITKKFPKQHDMHGWFYKGIALRMEV